MQAPSVTSFGAETPDDAVPVTLVSAPETLRGGDGDVALPPWPQEVITIAAFPEPEVLPAPAAEHFRYDRIIRSRAKRDKRRPNREITHSVNPDVTGSITDGSGKREQKDGKAGKTGKSPNPAPKPRNTNRPGSNDPIGHQIQISRPQASLTPPGR